MTTTTPVTREPSRQEPSRLLLAIMGWQRQLLEQRKRTSMGGTCTS